MSPNYDQFMADAWGPGKESALPFSAASNVVLGSNLPYTASDFLSIYPKFAGAPMIVTGTLTTGSVNVTGLAGTAGMAPGQLVTGAGIPSGSMISSVVDPTQEIALTLPASMSGQQSINIYNAMFVPMPVLNLYVTLASSSLVQARWVDAWALGMALYIAHFLTLYLRSDGDICSTPGQVAAAGLARGITVAKAAGGVSMGTQPSTNGSGLESWGAFTETSYGVQFATLARIVGSGPMLIY